MRPVPLCVVSSAWGATVDPVRINCEKASLLSTSFRMLSHSSGIVCHSSISLGVSPCSSVFELISIICLLCFNTSVSPKSSRLLACCRAVVVLPHHFGPSINTAPLPASLRASSLSAILGLYILPIFRLLLNLTAKILIIIELYKSFDAFSVVCGDFVRSFVIVLFGRLWRIRSVVCDNWQTVVPTRSTPKGSSNRRLFVTSQRKSLTSEWSYG